MKTTSLIFLVASLLFCLSEPILSQSGTFTVHLPKLGLPPDEEGQGWSRPLVWGSYDPVVSDDSIVVPNGRPIYALIVSGYAQNANFDQLLVYKFAKHLMENGAYVHYAWWNNLLAPYMERPLHYDQSYPGNLNQDFQNFTTVEQANGKALPGEDYQFVEDAKLFLSAIRQHNPDAMIIVVGHSMGGGAIVHLASPWNTDERIDILAPIDPVGNRNYPWATLRVTADDFNWTRWRVTSDKFLGYKAENYTVWGGCVPTGPWLANFDEARDLTPLVCRPPTIHTASTLTFGSNIVHLYHRWQREALFPFDFLQNITFGHDSPDGTTYQAEVQTIPQWCGFNNRCEDVDGWPEGYNPSEHGCCTPNGIGVGWAADGHGEIVGYRGPITDGGPAPLAVRVGTSPNCGLCPNQTWPWRYKVGNLWIDPLSSNRVAELLALESLPTSYWEHSPQRPQNCLVSDGLISLFNATNYTTSQWTRQPSGTSILLRSVFFTDVNNGWVVGDGGVIKRTTDGGNTWTLQASGTSTNMTDLYFTDANTGWVVGGSGFIGHTTNGGNTWTSQASGTSNFLVSVFFTDINNGWVVGDGGVIKHTTDGGNTWTSQTSGTTSHLQGVHFTNINTGWAVGLGGVIRHTSNGGNTWTSQASGTSAELLEVYFVDANTCWIACSGGIIKHTTDGGNTWPFLQPSGTTSDLYGVHFTDANTGWVVGVSGVITHTTDGGTTWTRQITGRFNNIRSVHFIDANTGWAAGSGGLILHTTNGGVTFVEENEIHEIPTDYNLSQNYPNPFNPSTKIRYSVPQSSYVLIKVFDILGSEVETLVNEERHAGSYELNWDAANLPSGIYFYRIQVGDFVETKKMVLMK